jgi:hypothetical protein
MNTAVFWNVTPCIMEKYQTTQCHTTGDLNRHTLRVLKQNCYDYIFIHSGGLLPAFYHVGPGSISVQVCIYGGQSSTEAGFLRVLPFPCQFSFHRMLHTNLSSWADTIGPLVAGVSSGVSLILLYELTRSSGKN